MRRIGQFILIGTLFLILAANMQATDSRKIVLTGAIYHELTPSGMVITSVDSLLNPRKNGDRPYPEECYKSKR